ncbi:MAG: 16S rRNA (uracil(1498)-N(3))-methyltransferase, partial [Flavobacteriales bacterium]|nr:16S rRNA (uracil(1498)-N(3))-methyltransferase [Flavobacteriales bacterium]
RPDRLNLRMRYFYAPEVHPLHALDSEESKHMARVLRAVVGDEFILIDGKGGRYHGTLSQVDKRQCLIETKFVERLPSPSTKLTLVISPTKSSDRFEWMLEKAMEYGVSRIQPVWTQRSERTKEKQERWQRILVSALKQSQQLWLTELKPAISWDDFLATAPGAGFIAHCEEGAKDHLFEALKPATSCWVAIGPEGDFTAHEIAAAKQAGAKEVSLGDQRLRTETAGLAAIQMFALAQRKSS